MIGLATLLANRTVTFRRQNGGVCVPKVAVTDCTLAIHAWKRFPELARSGFGAGTDGHAHNFTGVAVQGQPNPLLSLFAAYKRPQFITL